MKQCPECTGSDGVHDLNCPGNPRRAREHRAEAVYAEIREERTRQDEKWGGPDHDDVHHELDWYHFVARHNALAVDRPTRFRKQMIRVAALALAAVESYDRKHGRPEVPA